MKHSTFLIGIITAAALLALPELDARDGGGRGGGGGGRGGGGHGGGGHGGGNRGGGGARSVQRSPSMSRTTEYRPPQRHEARPERPQGGHQQISRPSQNQRPVNRPQNNFAHQHPVVDRHNLGNNVRHNVGTYRPYRNNWFHNDFWVGHHFHPPYYRYHNNWWRWTTPVVVTGWLGWNVAPIYYDYYIDNGTYYWGPTETPGTVGYVEQTQPAPAPTDQPIEGDWLPLGVFALSKDELGIAGPNIYLQLTLNKNGSIAGTYYNATTDQGYEVEGEVDKSTQTATMQVVDDPDSPVIETGLYNLTQQETPIRVHFADGRTENMLLIRLDEPSQ